MAAMSVPDAMAHIMLRLIETGRVAEIEQDLSTWSAALGVEIEELLTMPFPQGVIYEGPNVLVREEAFQTQDVSIFPSLKQRFKKHAFNVLKKELKNVTKEGEWRKEVVANVNRRLMASSKNIFAPCAGELWLATSSHHAGWMDQWQGPFGLHSDGLSFEWNFSGVYLRPVVTMS